MEKIFLYLRFWSPVRCPIPSSSLNSSLLLLRCSVPPHLSMIYYSRRWNFEFWFSPKCCTETGRFSNDFSSFLVCHWMGTLTSCSFTPLNSQFYSNPFRRAFREKIQCHQLNRLGGSCYLCRERSKKQIFINFGRFRCFSSNNNVDNEEESGSNASKDSNVTTAVAEEAEERHGSEFNSEKPTSPSASSKVPCFLSLFSVPPRIVFMIF